MTYSFEVLYYNIQVPVKIKSCFNDSEPDKNIRRKKHKYNVSSLQHRGVYSHYRLRFRRRSRKYARR